jgi:hypothetical protein
LQVNQQRKVIIMISTLTIPALKSLASDMGLTVPSKARKADIIALIGAEIDRLHSEAIAEDRTRVVRKVAAGYAASVAREAASKRKGEPKSYTERSISRSLTYARQNGYVIAETDDVYRAKHFTAKQRRRAAKKYKAQYAKLSRTLG